MGNRNPLPTVPPPMRLGGCRRCPADAYPIIRQRMVEWRYPVLAPGSRGLLADPRLDGPASAERQTRVDPSRAVADSGTAGGPRRIVGRLPAELRPLVPSRGRQRETLGRRGGPGGPAMASRHPSLPASVRVTRPGQITTARDWHLSRARLGQFPHLAPGQCRRVSHRASCSALKAGFPQKSPRS